jgi:hypothetical protein
MPTRQTSSASYLDHNAALLPRSSYLLRLGLVRSIGSIRHEQRRWPAFTKGAGDAINSGRVAVLIAPGGELGVRQREVFSICWPSSNEWDRQRDVRS